MMQHNDVSTNLLEYMIINSPQFHGRIPDFLVIACNQVKVRVRDSNGYGRPANGVQAHGYGSDQRKLAICIVAAHESVGSNSE